jgi:hypothetical protein
MDKGDRRVLKASKRPYCCVHEYTETGDYIKYGNGRSMQRIEFYDNHQIVDYPNQELESASRCMTEAEKAKYPEPTPTQMERAKQLKL